MLWKDREGSSNVEDRRGEGGGPRFPMPRGKLGLAVLAVVLPVFSNDLVVNLI